MRILALFAILVSVASCSKDQFNIGERQLADPPYEKPYKLKKVLAEDVYVDILWVIDNSGSMGSYQDKVIKNSAKFVEQFAANSKLQWRMGLISTDESERPYMGFNAIVDNTTPDAVKQFNRAVASLGTNGSADEKSFQPTLNVLSRFPNWLRPTSTLILIFVSDEYEQSKMTTAEFLLALEKKLGGDINRLIVYGVYSPGSNDSWNSKYEEVVKLAKGLIFDLESENYGTLLSNLGKDLVDKVTVLTQVIMLDQKPVIGSIRVVYKGVELVPGVDWTYNPTFNLIEIRNKAILDTSAPEVEISFEINRH